MKGRISPYKLHTVVAEKTPYPYRVAALLFRPLHLCEGRQDLPICAFAISRNSLDHAQLPVHGKYIRNTRYNFVHFKDDILLSARYSDARFYHLNHGTLCFPTAISRTRQITFGTDRLKNSCNMCIITDLLRFVVAEASALTCPLLTMDCPALNIKETHLCMTCRAVDGTSILAAPKHMNVYFT